MSWQVAWRPADSLVTWRCSLGSSSACRRSQLYELIAEGVSPLDTAVRFMCLHVEPRLSPGIGPYSIGQF